MKIIIFFFVGMMMINFINAELSNAGLNKDYNTNTKTVTIKSISNEKVADIQLLTPLHNKVIAGKDVMVANIRFNITDENYKEIINDLMMYNKKINLPISKVYTFKKKIEAGTNLIDVIEFICKEDEKNSSIVCKNEVTGKKEITVYDYKEFSPEELKGEVEIGLFTDVAVGEYVEWIPIFYNQTITEWADFEGYQRIEYYDGPATTYYLSTTTRLGGQTFTIGNITKGYASWILKGFSINMLRSGTPGTIRIGLYSVNSSGYPLTLLVENSTINANSFTIGYRWENITMPSYTMLNNTMYAIVINKTSVDSVRYQSDDTSPTYYGGQCVDNTVGIWAPCDILNKNDLLFSVYASYPDSVYPTFSNVIVLPTNGTEYAPSKEYKFNVTILNSNESASLELNRISYFSKILQMRNISLNYNATHVDLPAGYYNYSFKSYGNGSANLQNNTITYYYTIEKNSSYVLGIEGTTPIINGTTTDVVGSGCPPQLNCTLQPVNAKYGIGTVEFNYTTNGNENYTAKSVSINITIQASSSGTTTNAKICRYKKFGYYNLNYPMLLETNCI